MPAATPSNTYPAKILKEGPAARTTWSRCEWAVDASLPETRAANTVTEIAARPAKKQVRT